MAVAIKARGILFDMDGTLVETTAFIEQVWREVAIEHNVDPVEVLKGVHGRSGLDTLRAYFPPECQTIEFLVSYESKYLPMSDGIIAIPGALQLLTSLNPQRWAVVTAASKAWAETRLAQAGLPQPEHLVSAESVKVSKPNPEGYLKGANKLCLDPKDTLVFEDAVNGVLAGVAAGAT
ncbi:hypothetical protein EV174_006310, partial [Coemansia sp. RSA 2320]